MIVGVPSEIKAFEYRVGLTPSAVREYVLQGHRVLVQTGAGRGMGADDDAYRRAGATILFTQEQVFGEAELIVKVKEPQPSEWSCLREGQILFTYLHLAADLEQAKGLMQSGCTAIAYETVTDDGSLPLLIPMSEIAGRLSIEAAANALKRFDGGSGILIGGAPGVPAANVLILGGGVVAAQAARVALGLGANVTILDRSVQRLRELDAQFMGRIRTRFSFMDAVEEEIGEADVIIGAVLVTGALAPKLITRRMLQDMKEKAVIVDVAVDQGGCCETTRPTTHNEPTFEVDGVIHYCVANMPGIVPKTSSHALNIATLPFGLALASKGVNALRENEALRAGLNVHRGVITCEPVAQSLDLPFEPAEKMLNA
jgi:alanine dehydrogenase